MSISVQQEAATVIFLASRYKRCPSDNILVIFGKVGASQSARCIHGGGTLLMTEKIEQIVQLQVEAIRNIKIDKVTVWDSAGGSQEGGTATANFLAGLIKSLPPLHEVAGMAGIELPRYLGEVKAGETGEKRQAAEAAPRA